MPEETITPTVESSVESAVESQTLVETKPIETPTEPPSEPADKVEEKVESKPEGPSPEEIEKALNVYKALNDPNTGPQVVRMMADQLGITEKEVKKELQKPTAVDFFREALGPDYEFLAPKLGGAIDQYMQANLAPMRQQIERANVAQEFNRAIEAVNTKTKGDFNKHEAEIVKMMDVVKPAPGVSTEKYLDTLYKLAKSEKASAPSSQVKAVVSKMQQNAQENLPSPSAATENRVVRGPSLPSLEDSIAAALRNERFE